MDLTENKYMYNCSEILTKLNSYYFSKRCQKENVVSNIMEKKPMVCYENLKYRLYHPYETMNVEHALLHFVKFGSLL